MYLSKEVLQIAMIAAIVVGVFWFAVVPEWRWIHSLRRDPIPTGLPPRLRVELELDRLEWTRHDARLFASAVVTAFVSAAAVLGPLVVGKSMLAGVAFALVFAAFLFRWCELQFKLHQP